MTREPGESYMQYVRRAKAHQVGRAVKLADIHDHLKSIHKVPDGERLLTRYLKALEELTCPE